MRVYGSSSGDRKILLHNHQCWLVLIAIILLLKQLFQILTSVFLILPMYMWITFIPPKKKKAVMGKLYCMSRIVRKAAFCICENKDADQLRGNREADQRHCFRYTDSTIPLLSKSEISSL